MSLSAENQRRMARAVVRARALVAADARLGQSLPSRADFERVVAGRTSIEIVEAAALTYAERPALGRRRVVRGEALPELETFTYAELWLRVQRLASGLRASGVAEGDLVLLIGFSTVDHFVAELACHYLAAVSVPLAKSIAEDELGAIAAQCQATTLCCSADVVAELAARIAAAPQAFAALARAIVLDAGEDDQRVEVRGVEVLTCAACEERGRRAGLFPPVVPGGSAASPGGDDRLLSLVYTSGSTGEPKGAMFGERAWRARWATLPFGELLELPMVSLVFLPQNHMGGRNALANSWKLGGLAYLTHASDLSTLFEDLKLVRPTYLHLVPRLSEQLYQHYQRELARAGGAGAEAAAATASATATATASEAILAEMREQLLGGRLLLALTASAPTPPEVLAFVQRAFDIPVVNVFAGTEYGQLFVDGKVNRQNVLEHELVSAPELGYSIDDRPYPRGELWVRTARGITSYFKNEAATRALRDERGFLRTGDIFEQRGPDELVWIDRRNNVQKLAQGEFVNIGRLEALFSAGSPRFQQIYLHADSRRAYLAAVVVPADPAASEEQLRAELARVGAAHQLAAYEVPRLVLVEPAPFTRENGLLTSLGKLARPKLKQRYAAALEERYRAAEARQAAPASAEAAASGEAAPARLAEAVAAVLGLPAAQLELARSFRELGGDSLAAHALRARLAAAGVSLSLGKLLRSSLAELMRELAAPAPAALPSFAAVHGAQAVALAAAELRLARFGAPLPLLSRAAPPRHVLLTGATGYLGRFLCLSLLERAAEHGAERGDRVVCLVRGGDEEQARARLAACYGAASAPLAQRFAALAEHLVVVAGELEAPRFGLSEERYQELADDVGRVVHAAALVNHALPYAQLFDANVAGSAEVFRFCASRRIKRCAFVSTHSLSLALLGARALAREEDDLRRLGDGWRLDDAAAPHGDGYRASKWAGEVLAADLATSYGAPVDIFRCSLILPPARARGQLHQDDFFIRLVTSVVQTGLVPASFYAAGAAARPHLDGLPVDFLAEAIAAIVGEPPASQPTAGPTVYHAINPHDDGVSLDTVMRRLELRGYPISRIEDHATWFARFTAALAALPEAARAASSLPIAAQWRQPLDADRRRRVSAERFHARVRALRPGGALDIPRLDAELLELYLDDLVAAGLVPPPR